MTGFGRGESAGGGLRFALEIRCVNHRGVDVAVRMPREYATFEERLRAMAGRHVRRGRCEVVLGVAGAMTTGVQRLFVDVDLAMQYHKALQEIACRLGGAVQTDPGLLIAMPGVSHVVAAPRDPESDWVLVEQAAGEAFTQFDRARVAEGARLAADLRERIARLGALAAMVAAGVPEAVREQRLRLARRLATLLAETGPALESQAEARAEVELAAMAERADVSEELARIGSHLAQLRGALCAGGPVGRRCDFLAQELAREWATVGAKAADAALAAQAVEARVTVEQVREQVQNLE